MVLLTCVFMLWWVLRAANGRFAKSSKDLDGARVVLVILDGDKGDEEEEEEDAEEDDEEEEEDAEEDDEEDDEAKEEEEGEETEEEIIVNDMAPLVGQAAEVEEGDGLIEQAAGPMSESQSPEIVRSEGEEELKEEAKSQSLHQSCTDAGLLSLKGIVSVREGLNKGLEETEDMDKDMEELKQCNRQEYLSCKKLRVQNKADRASLEIDIEMFKGLDFDNISCDQYSFIVGKVEKTPHIMLNRVRAETEELDLLVSQQETARKLLEEVDERISTLQELFRGMRAKVDSMDESIAAFVAASENTHAPWVCKLKAFRICEAIKKRKEAEGQG
jgi:hypothetical protein